MHFQQAERLTGLKGDCSKKTSKQQGCHFRRSCQIILLMGQINSQIVEAPTILVQNWQPQDHQPHVFVNHITHEQVQKHFIRILIKDLPRETALFASRMSNHQAFICRLLYFHPAVPERTTQESEKDFREVFLYTDRMLPLKEWTQQKVKLAVQGFKRLVSVNGPIKITENMVCQNQNGEIKVWMSENPVNNHPDSKYMSEEQTVADFATILTKKNKDLAGKLMGCHTLRDILEKFSRTFRENSSPFQNYSHRASQSGDFKSTFEYNERGQNSVYRNVFGDPMDKRIKDQGFLTPKPANKNHEKYPQSAFSRVQDEFKPKSNMGYLQKLRQNAKNNQKMLVNAEEKSQLASAVDRKDTIQSSLQANPKDSGEEERKAQAKNPKIDQARDQRKKYYKLTQTGSYTNLQPQYNYHRFETTKLGSTGNLITPSMTSAKTLKSDQWKQNQAKNLPSEAKQNSFCTSSAANFPTEQGKRNYDITIINNNVNNIINNITHNHVLKVDKKPEAYQFRSPKTQESNQMGPKIQFSTKKQTNNMNAKEKTAFMQIPVFLQQKKRNKNVDEASSPVNSKIEAAGFNAQKKQLKSPHQQQQAVKNNQRKSEPFFKLQKSTQKHPNIPKLFHFNRNQSGISNGQQSPSNLRSPGYGQGFTSFTNNNFSFQVKSGLRTKTTQFFAKIKDITKIDGSIQNKSFTQNEKATAQLQSLQQLKVEKKANSAKIFQQLIEPKPKMEIFSEKTIKTEEPVPQQKQNFKKQLRNEFKFLLGGDPPKDEAKAEEPQISKLSFDISATKQGKQVEVKDKIIKKQMQFAELKKQALKVLIDM